MKKALDNHPQLDKAFKLYGPPTRKLWKGIRDEKTVYTRKTYINTKCVAVRRRCDVIFKGEKDRVTSHDLRRLYAHMAYTKYADKEKQSEAYYYKLVLGHDTKSMSNGVVCYTTVGFY